MKLTIIAATGGVGAELLQQALAAGHDVTAVVRNPASLSRHVRTVTTDMAAPDPAALESAITGTDAVLSALGPHSNSDAGIASQGTPAIVAAMNATGVRRIVAVSAAPVGTIPTPSNPSPPKHTTPVTGSSCGTWAPAWQASRWARSWPTSPRWRTSWPAAAWTGPSYGHPS